MIGFIIRRGVNDKDTEGNHVKPKGKDDHIQVWQRFQET
jgi:hypothetical protein